jgi:hypothetical protein
MTDNIVDGQILDSDEIELVRRKRANRAFTLGFYAGLSAGKERLESLANECNGGSGTGETADSFRMAAQYLDGIKAPSETVKF